MKQNEKKKQQERAKESKRMNGGKINCMHDNDLIGEMKIADDISTLIALYTFYRIQNAYFNLFNDRIKIINI